MQERILRKLFLGFIHIHILHHAEQAPIYGAWMLEELETHGYHMSPGTLYPILHQMAQMNLLLKSEEVVAGKLRKFGLTLTRHFTFSDNLCLKHLFSHP